MNEPAPLLLRALLGLPAPRRPVWAMRQAGRWDPEFRALRGEMDFYAFSRDPDLASRATLLPLRFGVDALILFYDITTLPEVLGLPFRLVAGRGPVPQPALRSREDLDRLDRRPAADRFAFLPETIRRVRRAAPDTPILAFAGAPYTVATYCIGAGRDTKATRRFALEQERIWRDLLDLLAEATIDFLRDLHAAGADAVQLFDSWAGGLSREEYDLWASPFHRRIFEGLGGIPSILFVRECPYADSMLGSGAGCISLGTCHDLTAMSDAHPDRVFQGNLDPELLVHGAPEDVADATRRCLIAGRSGRHVLNLSHGMLPNARPENFAAFVETAKSFVL